MNPIENAPRRPFLKPSPLIVKTNKHNFRVSIIFYSWTFIAVQNVITEKLLMFSEHWIFPYFMNTLRIPMAVHISCFTEIKTQCGTDILGSQIGILKYYDVKEFFFYAEQRRLPTTAKNVQWFESNRDERLPLNSNRLVCIRFFVEEWRDFFDRGVIDRTYLRFNELRALQIICNILLMKIYNYNIKNML